MEDRKRLLALPAAAAAPPSVPPAPPPSAPSVSSPDSCSSGPTTSSLVPAPSNPPPPSSSSLAVPGAPQTYASVLKPKPILVDKQASEPNTPTSKHFERPMMRGYSDVSQRMKKRVTLSSLPSRHSLEVKEPDLLQVPQVVQIEHLAAPYIDEDCDSNNPDDESSTIASECDSLVISEEDTIREEPATIAEENEVTHNFIIPTISASVALDSSLQVPPPGILGQPSDMSYHHSSYHRHYTPHHHHHHHYHRHPSSPNLSQYTLLPVLEPPTTVSESIELHDTERTKLLPPEIVTTIPMEESSS